MRSPCSRAPIPRIATIVSAGLLVIASDTRDIGIESSTTSLTGADVTASPIPEPKAAPFPGEPPLSCATLRDVALSDIVQRSGTTLFYADATAGLTVIDVAEAAHPRVLSVVPFVGTPLAMFVREGLASLVVLDPDSRSGKDGFSTVIRVVDVRTSSSPKIVDDEVRNSAGRDAKLIGGLLYLLRGSGGRSFVEAFDVQGATLRAVDSVTFDGAPAQLAASAAGLALVKTSENQSTAA